MLKNAQTRERILLLAGLLGLGGLVTALIYVLDSTPYTMVLFMMGGMTMIGLSVVLLVVALSRDVRRRMSSMRQGEFKPGETIFSQGDAADFMYVITEGEVSFSASEKGKPTLELGKLGVGDYFGDMAIQAGRPYQATAVAVTAVKVLAVHRSDFQSMFATLPDLRERVLRQQQRKLGMVKEALK